MSEEYEAAITKVLLHYFPHWDMPENRKEWNPCLCPAHDEDRPSCSVNFDVGAIKCQACGFKGNVISIIMRKEGMRYAEAVSHAENVLGRSYDEVPGGTSGKRGRRVFGQSRTGGRERGSGGQQVPTGVRGRTAPWS